MNSILKIEMIIIAVAMLSLIIHMLKNKNMSIKFSIFWLLLPIVFLIIALFSNKMIIIANLLGFELLSNLVFFLTVGILFLICFSLTIIVSSLHNRVIKLTQEIAILKKEKGE